MMSEKKVNNTTEEEKKKLLQEIIDHVEKERVQADDSKRRCVDGRYTPEQADGSIAIPGADLGISMALLKLGFSPKEAFDLVYQFVTADNKPYCWHTDTHEGHGDCQIGCGHCEKAIKKSEHYGVDSEKAVELLNLVRKAQAENPDNMDKIILESGHDEKAILVVTSSDYTVNPWDQEKDNQFFIYDKTRHLAFLKEFAEFAEKEGHNIDYNNLVKTSDEQTNATLGLLGSSKGKPMFSVDVAGDRPKVEYLEDAPIIND